MGLLIVMQTVLLVAWFLRLDAFDERLDQITRILNRLPAGGPALVGAADVSKSGPAPGVDGRQLRQIIREELQAALAGGDLSVPDEAAESEAPVYDDVEMALRKEWIQEELEQLKRKDAVSSMELNQLISAIARLDPERRSEMMREVNRAINQGEINGHL